MLFSGVTLVAVASVDAPHRVTSRQLEDALAPLLQRLGLAPGVIESLSGVRARRFWDEGTQPSDAAVRAAELVLARASIDRERVGLLVNTSVCRDFVEPSTAAIVHRALQLSSRCRNFDLGNACLGFLDGMEHAALVLERGAADYALVVDGENSRPVVERTIERLNASGDARAFAEEFATLTLGSGGAAALLARRELAPQGHLFRGGVSLAATEHHTLCRGQPDRMVTDGQRLLGAGIELARRTFALAGEQLGWSAETLDEAVVHQVSRLHTERLAAALGVELAKIHMVFPERGNVGPAALPVALAQCEALGRLRPGHRVGLLGIGSGLNCTMSEIVW